MKNAQDHIKESVYFIDKLNNIQEEYLEKIKKLKKEFDASEDSLLTLNTFQFLDFIGGKEEYKPNEKEIQNLKNLSKPIVDDLYHKLKHTIENLEKDIKNRKYYTSNL